MSGKKELAEASGTIDGLLSEVQAYEAALDALGANLQWSEQYRREQRAVLRESFEGRLRESYLSAGERLDKASATASAHLARPGDDASETRKARAAMRVSRLIDSGTSPVDAAEMLAEDHDVDGLRALRDEIPSWVTVTLPESQRFKRRETIDGTLLAVDRVLAPLLDGVDADAVQTRLRVDEERSRLDAVRDYAFNPTANGRMQLAYASNSLA